MSWLLVAKIMPVLYRGDPPNHHAATVSQLIDSVPVIWDLKWNFHSVGWAANHVTETPDGRLELLSRLQFSDWPETPASRSSWIMEQLAEWGNDAGDLQFKLTNRSLLDAKYRLEQLESSIYLGESSRSNQLPWMRILGKVDGNQLMLSFHLGDRIMAKRSIRIRPHSLISSEISPHGYMPPLTNPPTLEHLSDQPAPISDLLPRHNRCHCRAIRSDDLEWSTCRNTISCISQG